MKTNRLLYEIIYPTNTNSEFMSCKCTIFFNKYPMENNLPLCLMSSYTREVEKNVLVISFETFIYFNNAVVMFVVI